MAKPIIYLSSTYEDLKDYRRAVFEALRKAGYEVIAMEEYVARDQRPIEKGFLDLKKTNWFYPRMVDPYKERDYPQGGVPCHSDDATGKNSTRFRIASQLITVSTTIACVRYRPKAVINALFRAKQKSPLFSNCSKNCYHSYLLACCRIFSTIFTALPSAGFGSYGSTLYESSSSFSNILLKRTLKTDSACST